MQLPRIQRCFYKFYCVTKEDLKCFNRNLLACLHEDTVQARCGCKDWLEGAYRL